jgi:hypothetical protein
LDANLKQRKLTKVETKQKLKEIVERLKVKEEKNLELHNVIFEIDHQGEEV